jgi:hypothetical protein
MIKGVDSAYPPSTTSLQQAKAAGVRHWAGYFAGRNILHGWAHSEFQRVQNAGLSTMAYCSGWSDPVKMQTQSLEWEIPICLDVEGGIRGDGAWVQPWLDASGAGLYGNGPVFRGRRFAFGVVASRPITDPHATWPSETWWPRVWGEYVGAPAIDGWQWLGSHTAFGTTVDGCWLDDAFLNLHGAGGGSIGDDMSALAESQIATLYGKFADPGDPKYIALEQTPATLAEIQTELGALKQQIAALPTGGNSVDLTVIIAAINDLKEHPAVLTDPTLSGKIDALAKHLGVGTP